MQFYTSVVQQKNKMLVRGIDNGKPVKRIYDYSPYLFIPTNKETKFRTPTGQSVGKMDFDSIWDAKEFIKEYDNVEGMPIYGMTNFLYPFIFDHFQGEIKYDPSLISVTSLDIETKVGDEDIATAIQNTPNEVTAITISRNGFKTVFGCGDFVTDDPKITYLKCRDEQALLQTFLSVWNSSDYSPDVLTGWNVEFFDVPYLVGRIIKILGEEAVKRLSPWGQIRPYEVEIKGKRVTSYELKGIAVLDYMALYKKFTYTNQESYRLDHIAYVELGENKINYNDEGYVNLNDLYARNFQRYIEYNIHDVHLVDLLEDKMKLIELVFAMAYDAKVNYTDTLASVNQWDVIIHNYLLQQNIVVPQKSPSIVSDLVGGYVKDVQTGMHRWLVSFDLNSLYPHLIQQYNISPEMFVKRILGWPSIDQILDGYELPDTSYSVAANGCAYSKDRQGFLAAIMAKMYDDRVVYKRQMLEVKKEYEKTKNKELLKEISRLDNLQMAKKIQLNSAYGALGNKYFRWFDINHAEAITMSGQLSIRWIADRMNEYLNKLCKTDGFDYIVASDTDSIYVTLANLVDMVFEDQSDTKKIVAWLDKACKEKFEPFIDKSYQDLADRMGAFAQKMHMKRECIADKAIWTAKKRYILNVWNQEGVAYETAKLKMTGIEAVKSSTPQACRDALKSVFGLIMNKTEADLQAYVSQFRETFKTLPFQDIASPRGVSNLSQYVSRGAEMYIKGTPIHVKGSILYNKLISDLKLGNRFETVANGDKIKYCYLKSPNPYGTNVISCPAELPTEFGLNGYIDHDLQFEKAYLDPLSIVLNSIGWSAEKKSTLDSFFG
jgi:DNA polymerase elongation subunit (family B)